MASAVDIQAAPKSEQIVIADIVRTPVPLVAAPADWEHRGFVESYANLYVAALRRGSKADFLRLHLEKVDTANARDAARLAFGNHAGFKALRRMHSSPEMAIFRYETDFGPDAEVVDDGLGNLAANYSCTICFCISGNCAGRWPNIDTEADNREGPPYVCTDFGPYKIFRNGYEPSFRTWTPREAHTEM